MKNNPERAYSPSKGNARCSAGIVPLPCFHDHRGSLTVVEQQIAVPFRIERAFWIFGVPSGRGRGGHAHRKYTQLLVAVSGSFTVILDDGETSRSYHLGNPAEGLLVPPGVWNILENFSQGAVCLVLVSGPYEEAEYIREYDDFRTFSSANH